MCEPHLCQNPASLSAFSSPLNNRQSTARQGGCCHREPGRGVASGDMESPGANKRRHHHRDPLPWGAGLEQLKFPRFLLQLFCSKKHNLPEAPMTTPLFTETKWPQTLGLRGQLGTGGEAGWKARGGQQMLCAGNIGAGSLPQPTGASQGLLCRPPPQPWRRHVPFWLIPDVSP